MSINIEDKKQFKFSIDNSLGLIKIKYKTEYEENENIDKFPNKIINHENVLKIEEINNLFLFNEKITITTEKKEFIYVFENFIEASQCWKVISNSYINYYSIQINNKDLFEKELKPKKEKENKK